jgi:ATP-dependent exoDNAse (exonuclease V) alpha subunit
MDFSGKISVMLDYRLLVNFSSSRDKAILELVEDWKNYHECYPKKYSVVLAQRWAEVEAISKELRLIHQENGRVGNDNLRFECVVSNKPMSLPFSIGERVRFAKNDYRLGVSNGSLGTLLELKQVNHKWLFLVKLDCGRQVTISPDTYQDEQGLFPLVHAYAMTVYSSQGITVDGDVFILYNKYMDRANSYVAGSRHKDNCHWFIDQKEIDSLISPAIDPILDSDRLVKLAECMGRERSSQLAVEYLNERELVIDQAKPEISHVTSSISG